MFLIWFIFCVISEKGTGAYYEIIGRLGVSRRLVPSRYVLVTGLSDLDVIFFSTMSNMSNFLI